MSEEIRYADAGVDYELLDEAKRRALASARKSAMNPISRGASVLEASYGEAATIVEVGDAHYALVLECLGTKSVIAAEVEVELGMDRFADASYDTVAAAVNDCVSVGALPLVVNAYFAAGSGFYTGNRHTSLVEGFALACRHAGAAWGGGESPTLAGLVTDGSVDLAAAVMGKVPEGRSPMLGATLEPGDEIVLLSSSGLHQNGASLARRVAEDSDAGWGAKLSSGRLFGDAVLDPGVIYAGLVDKVFEADLAPHYASHVTGHGWRKLMRAERELTYRITALPDVPEVLAYLADAARLSSEEAYATLNMGAGFALFVGEGEGEQFVAIAASLGIAALRAGRIELGPRRVVIEPLRIEYAAETLEIR